MDNILYIREYKNKLFIHEDDDNVIINETGTIDTSKLLQFKEEGFIIYLNVDKICEYMTSYLPSQTFVTFYSFNPLTAVTFNISLKEFDALLQNYLFNRKIEEAL